MILFSYSVTGQIRLSDRVGKLILKDLAELDRRRKEAFLDSMSISALNLAYQAKSTALNQARSAINELEGLRNDERGLLEIQEAKNKTFVKEVKKQKFLKWLGFGGMALVATIAITKQ